MPNPSLHVPFELNTGRPTQIGLVVLQSDETIEQDMRRLIPSSAELLVSRVPSGAHVTPDSLAAMESELSRAAALFPLGAQCSTIGYGCTSGTAQIGYDRVAEMIRAGKPTPYVTEPVSALIAACHHLGLGRIGLLSPYIASVSERLRSVLLTEGIDVTAFASFNESAEDKVSLIAPSSIVSAAQALAA
ncbi:MAG: Asp/Glu racemase, partial [Pseudomonadota bacterium]